jgi:hypothetical protein
VSAIIKSLVDFSNIHKGSKIIVCGCGTSLTDLRNAYSNYITIGVNDVPLLFQPTYLLVTDHPGRFHGNRKDIINKSTAKHLFTCVKGWRHKSIVHFNLGSRELKTLDRPDAIDHFVNSPYVATILAYKLGATNIGLIGVDFTDGHFYNTSDGPHPVIKVNYLKRVNNSYQILRSELEKRGVKLYNLSKTSRLDIPKITLSDFDKL